MMQIRRPKEGEIVLDLGDFLPGGRQFWWAREVDEMVSALKEHMPDHTGFIINEVSARSHPDYQVLHIALSGGIPEEEFRDQAKHVIGHYLASHRLRRTNGHRAAS